jgi:prevent-host-death family protein
MTRVTATEFKNNIGVFSDAAMREPVIITSHDRDRLVLLSAEEYNRIARQGVEAEERKAQMRKLANYHGATLTELSSR